jgi:cellulose synthase (UDP-forming)
VFHMLRGQTAAWVPTGAARSSSSLARTVTRVMRTWVGVVQLLSWTGLAVAVQRYGFSTFWPMATLLALQSWVQLPLLLPVRSRAEWATAARQALRPGLRRAATATG